MRLGERQCCNSELLLGSDLHVQILTRDFRVRTPIYGLLGVADRKNLGVQDSFVRSKKYPAKSLKGKSADAVH